MESDALEGGPARQPSYPGAPDTQTMSNLIVIGIGLCMRLLHRPPPASPRDLASSPCRPLQPPRQDMGSRRPGGLWPRGTLVRTRVPTTTTERHVVPGRKSSSRWLIFEHYQRRELRPFEKDNKEKEAVASEGSWMCLPAPFPFTQHTPCTSGQSKLWKTKLQ